MKTIKENSICAICIVVMSAICISCSHNSNQQASPLPDGNGQEAITMEKGVQDFSSRYNDLLGELLKSTSVLSTDSMSEEEKKQLCEEIGKSVGEVLSRLDVRQAMKNGKQTAAPDKDSIAKMKSNPEMFLAYVKENGTPAYYTLIKQLMDTGKIELTKDDIISHPDLKMQEKLTLLIMIPVFEQSDKEMEAIKEQLGSAGN